MIAHTQDSVVVYVSDKEKKEIKLRAKAAGKSMSRYLLDLHLSHLKSSYSCPKCGRSEMTLRCGELECIRCDWKQK